MAPYRKLAHLNALRAFEAVARNLSFAAAARELSVTSGALSQQVSLLEAYYGVVLFRRHNRRISLTDEAQAVLADLETGFDRLSAAVVKLQSFSGGGRLAVTAPPTFAVKWLAPRLGAFHGEHPNIEVILDSTDRVVDLRREGTDVAIRYGRGGYPGLTTVKLADEILTAACAPAYAARLGLETPADLLRATLIHDLTLANHPSMPNWNAWLAAAGVPGEAPAGGLRVSSSVVAIQAAVDGQGVILGRNLTLQEELSAGRLVTLFPHVSGPGLAYYLVYADDPPTQKVAAFRDWLLAAFASS